MPSLRHSGGLCAGLDPGAAIQCFQEATDFWPPFFNEVTSLTRSSRDGILKSHIKERRLL